MVYNTQDYRAFALCHSSSILETRKHMILKLDLFPSSDEWGKAPTPFGPLEIANLGHWITHQIHYSYLITQD
jgi:hypothetical protein